MHIDPKNTGPVRPEPVRPIQRRDATVESPARPASPSATPVDRSDRVEISDAGRALNAREGMSKMSSTTLDPLYASRIRERILNGAYDTLEVVDAVARRLLDTGALS